MGNMIVYQGRVLVKKQDHHQGAMEKIAQSSIPEGQIDDGNA